MGGRVGELFVYYDVLDFAGRGALSSSGENIQLVANSDCDNRAHKITA